MDVTMFLLFAFIMKVHNFSYNFIVNIHDFGTLSTNQVKRKCRNKMTSRLNSYNKTID